ncbi:mitochondrial outer membrane translocase receptor TOM70 [Pseudohyphozyma bogoriensis]|nr:mitochondrial outer membrane translocase receptor TOM70 [Pseudohyphozyma bogoriensis]
MSASDSSAATFFTKHRQAILVGTAAVAMAAAIGGAYYLSSSSGAGSSTGGSSAEKKKKKKAKSKKKNGKDEPENVSELDEDDPRRMTEADIQLMDPDARAKLALTLKGRGNKSYSAKKFTEAIEFYTKAIECEEQAVFYSNRAACYTNLNQQEKVIEDCTDALRLDPSYIKALNRRATAREALGGLDQLYLSLCDFTAAAIIDNFATESTQVSVERVMKRLATEKAAELLKTREPRLPSATFIKAYLEAFRPHSAPPLPANPSQGDKTLQLAFDALVAKDFSHAMTLFHEALEQNISTPLGEAEALNMRATFRFIVSDAAAALVDLDRSTTICPEQAQGWVKKASVHMELGQPEEAFRDFDRALEVDPENPDVYYHRGQVYFITGEYVKAMAEYQKSSELDPVFIFSHIQLAVARYKSGETEKAMHQFRKFLKEFSTSPEVFNYYGELLLDQQKYEEAVANFERSIELDKDTVPRNVLPMINRALALFQWKQDFALAESICREAIEIDPQCDIGVATLAQLLLQQNKVHEAVGMFERSAEMSRTEPELINALTFENATCAQIAFITSYPSYAEKLGLNRSA